MIKILYEKNTHDKSLLHRPRGTGNLHRKFR